LFPGFPPNKSGFFATSSAPFARLTVFPSSCVAFSFLPLVFGFRIHCHSHSLPGRFFWGAPAFFSHYGTLRSFSVRPGFCRPGDPFNIPHHSLPFLEDPRQKVEPACLTVFQGTGPVPPEFFVLGRYVFFLSVCNTTLLWTTISLFRVFFLFFWSVRPFPCSRFPPGGYPSFFPFLPFFFFGAKPRARPVFRPFSPETLRSAFFFFQPRFSRRCHFAEVSPPLRIFLRVRDSRCRWHGTLARAAFLPDFLNRRPPIFFSDWRALQEGTLKTAVTFRYHCPSPSSKNDAVAFFSRPTRVMPFFFFFFPCVRRLLLRPETSARAGSGATSPPTFRALCTGGGSLRPRVRSSLPPL